MFVRESAGRPLAAFCINFDTTDSYTAGQREESGTFLLKGAVEQVAQMKRVTKSTVYNYLKKVRNRTSTVGPEEYYDQKSHLHPERSGRYRPLLSSYSGKQPAVYVRPAADRSGNRQDN
ncbi:helix-turn-helix domain-containing protein [Desulfocastanea catecholica]